MHGEGRLNRPPDRRALGRKTTQNGGWLAPEPDLRREEGTPGATSSERAASPATSSTSRRSTSIYTDSSGSSRKRPRAAMPRGARSSCAKRLVSGGGRPWPISPSRRSHASRSLVSRELRTAAHEELIEAELELGRHSQVVAQLEALVAEHPLRSDCGASSCWPCTAQAGRPKRWRRIGKRARRSRRRAPGSSHSTDLQRLEQSILRHDSRPPTCRLRHAKPRWLPPRNGGGLLTLLFAEIVDSSRLGAILDPEGPPQRHAALFRHGAHDRRAARRGDREVHRRRGDGGLRRSAHARGRRPSRPPSCERSARGTCCA